MNQAEARRPDAFLNMQEDMQRMKLQVSDLVELQMKESGNGPSQLHLHTEIINMNVPKDSFLAADCIEAVCQMDERGYLHCVDYDTENEDEHKINDRLQQVM